jgi:hypothetical protein
MWLWYAKDHFSFDYGDPVRRFEKAEGGDWEAKASSLAQSAAGGVQQIRQEIPDVSAAAGLLASHIPNPGWGRGWTLSHRMDSQTWSACDVAGLGEHIPVVVELHVNDAIVMFAASSAARLPGAPDVGDFNALVLITVSGDADMDLVLWTSRWVQAAWHGRAYDEMSGFALAGVRPGTDPSLDPGSGDTSGEDQSD